MKKNKVPENGQDLTFTAQDFSQQSFAEYSFSGCVFEQCNFTDSSFEKARLWGCIFRKCNFSMVNVQGLVMEDVFFEESKVVGIQFTSCDTSLFFSIKINNSFFQYCNFSFLNLKKISFKKSKLIECRFIDTILQDADFDSTDLAGTVFHNCDLRKARFETAFNYRINPCENKIQKATFSSPESMGLVEALDIVLIK